MVEATGLAALAAAAALLGPAADLRPATVPGEASRHRESAITTTLAPQIAGPIGPATLADSLRWTSVPHADRYQVSVFDREGTLVWESQTRDTSLRLPARLRRAAASLYLWKVEARTGWDRWVASEWEQFTIGAVELPR